MGTIAMTDAELLEASRRGERHAFGELVERYQRMVSAVSYSRTRDQALSEDVAQETFIAAWKQLDQLREPGRLRSWLCGIARNIARKTRRRSDREVLVEPELAAHDNPFDAVCTAQAERVVGEALARVPDTYRDVLVLYYREQQSVRDVAAALGISEAAALQRLSRGRQYLADGVKALVEKSLRGQRPRRNLVAAVLAALPAASVIAKSSRVEASTSSHGGRNMLKLVLAGAAFVAAGTTAVVVTRSGDPAPQAATVAQTAPTPAPRIAHAPTIVRRQAAAQPGAPAAAEEQLPPNVIRAPEPDKNRVLDRAMIEKLKLDRGPGRGPANAPVTITLFTDLQCPYCMKAQTTIDQLFDDYPGKLRLVIKQMPVHQTARLGAEAAYAADAQGKFKELDELMIANHEDLSKPAILNLAQQAGMDVGKLEQALDKHTYADSVDEDIATAQALEFNGTPSFVINGRRMVGALPIAELRRMIDDALRE